MYSLSEEPLITRRQIDERLKELAESIKAENFDMFLSTLTGGFMFTADLCRNIASSKLEIEFIRASSYGDRTETSGDVEISGFEGLNIQGKKVLLIDDILDTGNTMSKMKKTLLALGPREIKTCVFLDKKGRREVDFEADFVGFTIENEFVVGYGLDYANMFRSYPEIWTVRETDGK
jgi:hypoxanthine phosphoribosyltransferase